MSRERHEARERWPIVVLIVAAIVEVVVNRMLIGTKSAPGFETLSLDIGAEPTLQHKLLSNLGLFVFYFTGAFAAALVISRAVKSVLAMRDVRETVATVVLALGAALAALPLLDADPDIGFVLELVFALGVIATVASAFGKGRDLGTQIGIVILAIPLAVHTVAAFGTHFVWVEHITFDGPVADVTKFGVFTLAAAALVSPYCFAPRPFSRAVTKPIPVLVAMAVAAFGAIAARAAYPTFVKGASLAIGVELTSTTADRRLAIYLLSVATLVWTLASCAFAQSNSRKTIGAGIALLVLGGYAFKWPNHYLLPLLGLSLVAEGARGVRDEELAAMPIESETPPIADPTWTGYVTALTTGLRRVLDNVHSLTTRGEAGVMSTVIVGDTKGMAVRARVERIHGAVLGLDVVVGREVDEVRAATLTLWAIPTRETGANPPGPPAAPLFKAGDVSLDNKFRLRGSLVACNTLLDETLRMRVAATLDGWLAYWDGDGLRYRIYPGRGAPLDHPMPLSDLALGRPAGCERLVAVFELLVEIARRGVKVEAPAEPKELAAADPEPPPVEEEAS